MSRTTDWRLAGRMFVRQPGLTTAAVIALALGVGLPTLLFSIAYGIFLRGLPFPAGDRIVAVTLGNVATGRQRLGVTIHDFADWQSGQTSFEEFAAFQTSSLNVVVRDGQPERLAGAFLTVNGFAVMGARPLMGRTFVESDAAANAAPVLVLGYGPWASRFGSDPGIVGRIVRANGHPATIVGVMPAGFGFPSSQEAWMPLRANPLEIPRGGGPALIAYGRLKRSAAVSRAQADLVTIAARIALQYPETNRNLVPVVQPYTDMMSGDQNAHLAMLLTMATGFGVLLIACANVANLLFARAASRTREMAIRSALGAGRRRIVAQLLIETAALAITGTAVGLVLAEAGIALFNRSIVDSNPPFWIDVRLDAMPLLFATALTGLAALLSGAIPAWRASRADLDEMLKDGARSAGGLRMGRVSRALVTAEIVLSFGLLVTAGLMIRSIANLGTHQYGFAMDDVFTARLVLPEGTYPDAASRTEFVTALESRLSSLPGVRSATLTSDFPGLEADRTMVAVDGVAYADMSHHPVVRTAAIGARFFETFGRRLARGREFGAADDAGAPTVAIVNAAFADQYCRGADPIGRRIRLGRDRAAPWLTIIGVAPDLYMSGAENREPAGVYVPLAQSSERALGLAVRGSGRMALASSVRAQVSALDRDLPIYLPKTLAQAVDDSVWAYRVFGPLLVAVGAAALFLAAVGLYSLMAFAARQRRREIGVRMALGASPLDVARLVAGEITGQIGIGLLAGAGLGAGLSSAMRSMVFHVPPHDPAIYASIVVTLVLTAAVAAFVPVMRAIRVDPSVTLRNQ
jgi:putative ABC transport system permease protein